MARERKDKRSYKYKVAALKAANAALLQPLKQIHNTLPQNDDEKEGNISESFIMLVKRVRIRLGFTQAEFLPILFRSLHSSF